MRKDTRRAADTASMEVLNTALRLRIAADLGELSEARLALRRLDRLVASFPRLENTRAHLDLSA
jgi:hypothetical protein